MDIVDVPYRCGMWDGGGVGLDVGMLGCRGFGMSGIWDVGPGI